MAVYAKSFIVPRQKTKTWIIRSMEYYIF